MLLPRELATLFMLTLLGIALPGTAQVAFGPTDPARGFDNPAPQEEARPAERPGRFEQSARLEPVRTDNPPALSFVPPPEPRIALLPAAAPRPVSNSFDDVGATSAIRDARSQSAKYVSLMALPEPQLAIVTDTTPALEPLSKAVQRALATNSMLDTPFTAEVDALEAARRARQSGVRVAAARPVILSTTVSRESRQISPAASVDSRPYYLWAGTFFLLAASLLLVGWQVIRLILGRLSTQNRAQLDGNISAG